MKKGQAVDPYDLRALLAVNEVLVLEVPHFAATTVYKALLCIEVEEKEQPGTSLAVEDDFSTPFVPASI